MDLNCEKCGNQLAPGAAFCSRCGAPLPGSDTHVPGAVGQVLDEKWRLERKIGEGGMGTVYLAHDLVLDRKVAIKLLARGLIHDADLVGRFEREAKLTAGLEHPNIVPVYSVGRSENRPYMVMKYLEGTALSTHLRSRGTLARDELLGLVRQVCGGLDFIHSRGFIHRDIKAGNIFVGPTGLATILDFGILRPSRNAEAITRTGMVMGTPQYMSPEQALGIRDIDHRADLYALAVVIFECLTGALPFEADNDLKIVQLQAHGVPPDVRLKAPWLPEPVSAVLSRALAKKPEQRFASANDLYLSLEAAFGVRSLTGPGGVPILEAAPPLPASSFPSVPGLVPYPIALQQPSSAPSAAFPIPLEPTPPAPGELRDAQHLAGGEDEPLVGPKTRPSRPTAREAPSSLAAPVPAVREGRRRGALWAAAAAGLVLLVATGFWLLAPAKTVVTVQPSGVSEGSAPGIDSPLALSPAPGEPPVPKEDLPLEAGSPPPPEAAVAQTAEAQGAALAEGALKAAPLAEAAELEDAALADAAAPEDASAAEGTPDPEEAGSELAQAGMQPVPPEPEVELTALAEPVRPTAKRRPPARPAVGKINVITTYKGGPYWASILVNGKRRGTTPALLELPAGRHRLRLERAGFRPVERQIKVASGGSAVVRIELIP